MKITAAILLTLFLLPVFMTGQNKFDSYYQGVLGEYEMRMVFGAEGDWRLMINAVSLDKNISGGFCIMEDEYTEFYKGLKFIRDKYQEWTKIAIDNKVESFMKTVDIDLYTICIWADIEKGYRDEDVKLVPRFNVTKVGRRVNYNMNIYSGELQDVENKYSRADDFVIFFESHEQMTHFLSKISPDKIQAYLTKPRVEDLFKD